MTSKTTRPYRVTVFCSANAAIDARYFEAATRFVAGLRAREMELLYGGASVGLMGHFAREMLRSGGRVRGALTAGLAREAEMPQAGLHELHIVEDLFERKRWFMEEGDAFVIFPGGFGTLDEALEVITWKALGHHAKPVVFVNVGGFWQTQILAFREFESRGMIRSGNLGLFEVRDEVDDVFAILDRDRDGRVNEG